MIIDYYANVLKKYDHRLLDKCLTKQNAFFCNVKVTASHSKTLNNSAY